MCIVIARMPGVICQKRFRFLLVCLKIRHVIPVLSDQEVSHFLMCLGQWTVK